MLDEQLKSSPADFSLYPLLWLAACFASGILTSGFLPLDWQAYTIAVLVFTVLTLVFIKRKLALIFLFSAFTTAGGLYFQVENQTIDPSRLKNLYDTGQIVSDDPIEIEGVLRAKPELAAGGFFIEIKTERAIYKTAERKVSGNIKLFAPVEDERIAREYEQINLGHNSKILVACRLRRQDSFLNESVVSQKELLDQSDTDATGIIKSPLLVEKIGESNGFAPLESIYDSRENLIVAFRNNFNVSTAGVLIASLLGNKYFLDKPTAEIFREGGTFHVLVISGLHITFIGGLVLLFVRLFTKKRFWQFLITCVFLWAFSIAVGAQIPVVRAALMFTILLFSGVIYRPATLLNSLGACAFVLLLWRPNDIFTQSFQLTFTSVAALICIAFPLIEKLRAIGVWTLSADTPAPPPVPRRLKRFCETVYWRENVWLIEKKRNVWTANLFKSPYVKWREHSVLQQISGFLFEAVLVSLVVQICLLPLSVLYFHRVSLGSVLLNVWVGFVIALETFTALFAVLLAQFSRAFSFPFVKITEFLNWLLISVPEFFIENNWVSFRVPNYSGAMKTVYFLYFLPVLIVTFLLYDWKPFAPQLKKSNSKLKARILRAVSATLLILIAFVAFHPFSAPAPDGRLLVDFLDVGQGDAALITFPNGETMLVDGGGRVDYKAQWVKREGEEPEFFEPDAQTVGETVVSRFLWAKGYDRIDYILATHADADHIQGLADVAKNFRVKRAMFGRTPEQNREFAAVQEILQNRGVPIVKLSRGDVFNLGGVTVEVLSPEKDESNAAAPSDNNHSVVLRLIYGNRKILLTGDIEKEAEKQILAAPESLKTDVIKVAHHGSRTSSTPEFIEAAGAKLAVISVGRESPFGHPHEEIVRRWKDAGAVVLTTGERGTVSISTDGTDLQVKTFLPE